MPLMLPEAPRVAKSDYQGFGPTIVQVCRYIREAGDSPEFQAFAAGILDKCYARDKHTTVLERAQCLLDYQNKFGPRFAPDPPNSERLTHPKLLFCLDSSKLCLAMEDCESQLAGYLSLCRASGIDCRIVIQKLQHPDGKVEWHMIGMVQLDDGSMVRVDPSLKGNSKVGQYERALQEQIIDPLDPATTGSDNGPKLVTIGARTYWSQPMQTQTSRPVFAALGHQATLGPKGRNISKKPCCKECAKSGGTCGGAKKLAARPVFDHAGRMVTGKMEASLAVPPHDFGTSWWDDMS